jgi:hypothetical protein
MNVTQNVIHDLLPVYLAGEASPDTVALVEEFLRLDPELARSVETLRANPLPDLPAALRPTKEKETLNMTKRLLRWRGVLLGFAIFLTMLLFSQVNKDGRIVWTFLHDAPVYASALAGLGALSCWCGFFYVRGRLRGAGI